MSRGQISLFHESFQEPKKSAQGGAGMERDVVARLRRDDLASMSCMDNLDFMRPLADGTMNLILTSPPIIQGRSMNPAHPLNNISSSRPR